MRSKEEHIYHVSFKEPRQDGRTEFYFTSLAAIYGQFSRDDIGCRVERLWAVGVSGGNRYDGRKCTITRETVYRKNRNNGRKETKKKTYTAILFEKLAGLFQLHGLAVFEIINGDIADLVIFDFAAGNIQGRTAAVIYHKRKTIFVLRDWLGRYPETLDEIKDYDWMDKTEYPAVMFEGLPRLTFRIE